MNMTDELTHVNAIKLNFFFFSEFAHFHVVLKTVGNQIGLVTTDFHYMMKK